MIRDPSAELALLALGRDELERRYGELIRASVPPNPAFDFERTIASLPAKRDLVFVLGLLSDGENEAALCLELADEKLAAAPGADVTHILEEAWYYLRTSADLGWQIDDEPVPVRAMFAYLDTLLRSRLERLECAAPREFRASEPPEFRTALLRRLRSELM
jgi:hypothetical protein